MDTGFPSGQTRSVCPEITLKQKISDRSDSAKLKQNLVQVSARHSDQPGADHQR